MTETQQGTEPDTTVSDSTTSAPVRVPNVSPGAVSGLDHEVIGSAANDPAPEPADDDSDIGEPESDPPPMTPEERAAQEADGSLPAAPQEATTGPQGDVDPSGGAEAPGEDDDASTGGVQGADGTDDQPSEGDNPPPA